MRYLNQYKTFEFFWYAELKFFCFATFPLVNTQDTKGHFENYQWVIQVQWEITKTGRLSYFD